MKHAIDLVKEGNEVSEQNNWYKNTREKFRRNPRRSAAKLAAEAGVSQTSMRRVLKDDLKTSHYKMQTRHELTDRHERMRLERCQHILDLIEDGTLPNLVFSDEKKFDIEQSVNRQNDRVWSRDGSVATRTATRRQNLMSVMVWAAVTATGRSPLVFVPSGVKLESAIHFGHFGSCVVTLGP